MRGQNTNTLDCILWKHY